ncbi:MAG: hypothetical protein JWN48_5884, partial [Myxococcaceae bacterium]|nr:hypothetical protein [Myxococcaceae bacterium]
MSAVLLLVLSLRVGLGQRRHDETLRPPALPKPTLASPLTAQPPSRSPRTEPRQSTAAAAQSKVSAPSAPVEARLRSELDRSYREPSPRAAARREAVDLLLSGRTRAALDAYRA